MPNSISAATSSTSARPVRVLGKSWSRLALTLVLSLLPAAVTGGAEPVRILNCTITPLQRVVLAADRPGILQSVSVEEGDVVATGRIVAQLRNQEAAALVATAAKEAANDIKVRLASKMREVADAELDQARATNSAIEVVNTYELRRLELARDHALLEEEQAVHDLELKKLELAEAVARLEAHDIGASINGIVVRVYKKPGEAVQQGDPVIEIVDTSRVKIEGYAPISAIVELKPGLPVSARYATTSASIADVARVMPETFTGTLRFVDVTARDLSEVVRVWAEFDSQQRHLIPGLDAEMVIDISAARETSAAP